MSQIIEFPLSLDEAMVTVEFTHEVGYRPTLDDPGEAEDLYVNRVRIGDAWVDSEYFAEFQLTRWVDQGWEKLAEARTAEDDRIIALGEERDFG